MTLDHTHRPAAAGLAGRLTQALAIGAGLAAPLAADAAMVITSLNRGTADSSFVVDLDGDGGGDFGVYVNQYYNGSNGGIYALSKSPWVSVDPTGQGYAMRKFNVGDTVDASTFGSGLYYGSAYKTYGSDSELYAWQTVGDHGYVGLKMELGDGTHYGWLELTRGSMDVGSMGYQTTPDAGAPIGSAAVPEPGSLALVALGGAGIAALRRRRSAATAH